MRARPADTAALNAVTYEGNSKCPAGRRWHKELMMGQRNLLMDVIRSFGLAKILSGMPRVSAYCGTQDNTHYHICSSKRIEKLSQLGSHTRSDTA